MLVSVGEYEQYKLTFIDVYFRLQHIIDLLETDSTVNKHDIIKNLKYSIAVLDTLYIEETK